MSRRFYLPPTTSRRTSTIPRINFWWVGVLLFAAVIVAGGLWWSNRSTPSVMSERMSQTLGGANLAAQKSAAVTEQKPPVPESVGGGAVDSFTHLTTAVTSSVGTTIEHELADSQAVTGTRDSVSTPVRRPLVDNPVRIQLLNGTKTKGLARTMSQSLRAMGFDVREVGNAGHFGYTKSQLIDRSGTEVVAKRVADSIGVSYENVSAAVESRLVDIDVTFVLGADFKNLRIAK